MGVIPLATYSTVTCWIKEAMGQHDRFWSQKKKYHIYIYIHELEATWKHHQTNHDSCSPMKYPSPLFAGKYHSNQPCRSGLIGRANDRWRMQLWRSLWYWGPWQVVARKHRQTTMGGTACSMLSPAEGFSGHNQIAVACKEHVIAWWHCGGLGADMNLRPSHGPFGDGVRCAKRIQPLRSGPGAANSSGSEFGMILGRRTHFSDHRKTSLCISLSFVFTVAGWILFIPPWLSSTKAQPLGAVQQDFVV